MSAVPHPTASTPPSSTHPVAERWRELSGDWSSDRTAFKQVPWGKAMMWIFLLSDTFIFGSFLTGYMTVRMSTTVPWPNPSEVFALHLFGQNIPLVLIAIMTFILITSSGTMAMAVNFGYRRDRRRAAQLMVVTAFFGAMFVGMQAFEWTKLITGFHGLHVSIGVLYLLIVASKVHRGHYEKKGYQIVEIAGLYWHFVDLVWVFIFAFFYLW
jgi:cytochrome c oxidase subunit 3